MLKRSDKGLPTDRINLFIASRKGAKDATTLSMIVSNAFRFLFMVARL